ncbi:HAD family phosphatase [Bifidobacterium tsurumiense]|uniref:Hydrolyase n=1 Tax=Bifidobacterium tsurumiense TaxID=356829 RepID=A0A087EDY8_9BIFI|nr:hydrolyase [Bifidobacterium tsurumiense]MSS12712.1 HAD family phosphatase [Bifidobacterium tsurumiense]
MKGNNIGKAAIFDLDGTLLDSMGVWDHVDDVSLNSRGIAVPEDYAQAVSHMQFREIADYTIARFNLSDDPQDLMDEWNALAREAYATIVEVKPHAVEYLASLKASGAKLAVATTLPPQLRDPAMDHVGIAQFFDEICSTDDVQFVGKDQPDVYLHAASLLNIEPHHCTVFEDILPGLQAAQSVGMKAWAMHDDSSDALWPQICEVADGVLFDFSNAPLVL